jgi:hypothetical protein
MSLWKLAPGDCFDVVPGSGQEPHVAVVRPCAEPHSLELMSFLLFPAVEGAPWPGNPAASQFANPGCSSVFVDYVGLPDAESIYNYAYIPMAEAAWNAGERRIPCSVGSDDGRGKVRGSVKGFSR